MIDSLNLLALLPLAILIVTAMSILLLDLLGQSSGLASWTALTSLVIHCVLTLIVVVSGQGSLIQNALHNDGLTALWAIIICSIGVVTLLIEPPIQDNRKKEPAYYVLVLFAVIGALIMVQSVQMLTTSIGLALLLISLNALTAGQNGWNRIILHGMCLAQVLLGAAFMYGATGSLYIEAMADQDIWQAGTEGINSLGVVGLGLVVSGLTSASLSLIFLTDRTSRQPASQYLCALLLPYATIAALGRLQPIIAPALGNGLPALGALCGAGCALAAYRTHKLDHLLNWRAVAHFGILLIVISLERLDWPTVFYLGTGQALGLSALWVLSGLLQRTGISNETRKLNGLGQARPGLALMIAAALFSLAGLLPLSGGVGMLWLLKTTTLPDHSPLLAAVRAFVLVYAAFGLLLAIRLCVQIWQPQTDTRRWKIPVPELVFICAAAVFCLLGGGLSAQAVQHWIAAVLAF